MIQTLSNRSKRMKLIFLIAAISTIILLACQPIEESTANTEHTTAALSHSVTSLSPEVLRQIKVQDSLLFQVGFNQIDTAQVAALLSSDFEFYHDEHGITDDAKDFVLGIGGLNELSFTTWRVLLEESSEMYPLYQNNHQELYGVIQIGMHEFYQQEEGAAARKSSTARFNHLWILEEGAWKLKRVLSYDHQVPS